MSLTSYRAAPPRVNFCRPSSDGLCLTRRMASKKEPPRKGGTYNRFGEDVKHGIGAKTGLPRAKDGPPRICLYMGIFLRIVKRKPVQAPRSRPAKETGRDGLFAAVWPGCAWDRRPTSGQFNQA